MTGGQAPQNGDPAVAPISTQSPHFKLILIIVVVIFFASMIATVGLNVAIKTPSEGDKSAISLCDFVAKATLGVG